jgi:D-glycerate 3-kinase
MISPALIDVVCDLATARDAPGRPPLIGICGPQGSGKTTLARAAAGRLGGAAFSLDDVYLTRADRAAMARAVHPLFAVRGPPGTHDLDLADSAVAALRAAGPETETPLPAFDKLADDRRPAVDWPTFRGRPRAILIEGWCLGATRQTPESLVRPVNALEREDDPDAVWRSVADKALAGRYQTFFGGFDAIIMLAAPSFDAVLDWRCEQEAGLLGLAPDALPPARRLELARFIQHFERITRHMLAGGVAADMIVRLGPDRGVLRIES